MRITTLLTLGFGCGFSQAALVATPSAGVNAGGVSPYTALSNDLFASATITGEFHKPGFNSAISLAADLNILKDGLIPGNPREPGTPVPSPIILGGSGSTAEVGGQVFSSVTFSLDLGASPNGYDITNITTYGGWADAGRDAQQYSVKYSTVANPTAFFDLIDVNYNPSDMGSVSTRVVIADTANLGAVFASGVHSIQFVFSNATEHGGTGYSEFDAIGTATVPEPSSAALLGLGLLGALRRRR